MNKIKNAVATTKKFVEDHRVGIAIITTALAVSSMNRAALQRHDDFLESKGLKDEFYHPED